MPLARATSVAPGVGSSTGLTSCRRTTRSHTTYSASGPISGSRRAAVQVRGGREAGAAAGMPARAVLPGDPAAGRAAADATAAWLALPAGAALARLALIASMAQPLYSIEATSTFCAKMPLSANRSKNFWKY